MKQTTKNIRKIIFLLGILLLSTSSFAQIININNAADPQSDLTLQELVEQVLVSGNCAEVSGFEIQTYGNSRETNSYGYFRRPITSAFPFAEGIVLSTGRAFPAGNITDGTLVSNDNGVVNGNDGDLDLEAALGISNTNDATFVKFEFTPTSTDFSFDFIMASEEYDGSTECAFADGFAFLIRLKGTFTYDNLAVLPNSTPVSVTNINNSGTCAANTEFFEGYNVPDTNYGGRTKVLTASYNVTPGEVYEIKLVVADQGDSIWDSAIFLNAGDFNFGLDLGDDFVSANDNAVCGETVELTANIPNFDYQWLFNGTPIAGATAQNYTASSIAAGGLGPGTYRCEISSSNGSCTGEDEIEVEFVEPATINPVITPFELCDADGDLIETFDLTTKDTEILNGQDPVTFDVQYYTDAGYTNQIANPGAFNNTSPTQTIYARVVNRISSNCFADNSFTISVTGLPIPTQPTDYEICDDDTDGDDTNGFLQNFLLSTKDAEILGALDPAQYNVSYHTTLTGAQTSSTTDVIDKDNPYTNITVNTQEVFVRVENVDNRDCNNSALSFNLIVSELPTITALVELQQCDDDTDGFSAFNLFEAGELISANFMNETFEFFESQAEAIAGTPVIPNPTTYTNQIQSSDVVWARAISTFGCYRIAQVNLTVATSSTQVTNFPVQTFIECDDFLDINGDDNANNDDTDGVTAFDFSNVTTQLLLEFPVNERPNLIITYYRNEADALAELNVIADPSNYRNIGYPSTQQIYVRVDNNLNNECIGVVPLITLNVDPVPSAAEVDDMELCDNLDDGDGFNGIVQTFNLDAQTPLILNGQNPADYTVTYHTSAADALAGSGAIASTAAYTNITPNLQTIYVRVTNNTTLCYTNHTSFDLIVNQLPVANFVADLEICDDDSDGSAQNGFSQSFDLELQTATILGGQDPTQFNVTYHATLADAQAGTTPLGSPFSNSVPFSQIIYVRVTNGDTGCANGISNFNAIVNPEPITVEVSNLSYCDDDLDGDDTNGFVQNIDLDSLIPGILGPTQDEDDYTVTFHESQADATDGMNALTSPYTNTTANQQTIYVRVVNDDTGCVNDDFTFQVIVNPLPVFSVTSPQIVCLNGPELVLSVENPGAVYDYVWTDPTGNMLIGSQISITSGGLYSVTATTTDGTACARTREIQVNESIIATITEDDVTIVDDSANNSIAIDPTNLGIGDYEYALTDENGTFIRVYQDDPLFENLEGGFYTILVRDKNGCGVASLDTSVVEFPKFFTPNNDGINDTWAIKGANSFFFPNSEVNIFNRFGKVVAQISIDNPGWDGTFNGKTLPSDDYWFSIKLTDRNGITRERAGNMSLVRR